MLDCSYWAMVVRSQPTAIALGIVHRFSLLRHEKALMPFNSVSVSAKPFVFIPMVSKFHRFWIPAGIAVWILAVVGVSQCRLFPTTIYPNKVCMA